MELVPEKNKTPEHASYAAVVINAPSLPVEVTPRTQKSYLKRKDWKVDRAVQSRDRKIQKLQNAVTSEKVKHYCYTINISSKIQY